jgi:hypothetical protein
MEENLVKNVIRDTRKDVKYVIWAKKKLSRDEMLRQIRYFNYNSLNIRQKQGSTVEIIADKD